MPSYACHNHSTCYDGFLFELFPHCPREGSQVLLLCLSLAQQLLASKLCSRQNEQDLFSAFYKKQVQRKVKSLLGAVLMHGRYHSILSH